MTIVCKMNQCPYNDKKGFCTKPNVISITQLGMCSVLYKGNGQQKLIPWDERFYITEPIEIEEAEFQVIDVYEPEIKEKGETRHEKTINGDAATSD